MTSISSSASANRAPGTAAADPLIGRVLDGRFRILSPIARGGMGAVYKAEQAPLGRLVALKIMSPRNDEQGNAEFRRRFFLEASTAAKLTHPNTVRVFDYGQTDDGFFFIAMELLEGRTLKRVIAEEGALEPARAGEIAKQVCRSLREAHRAGIVHRDVKPGNIMLVERGGEELAKVLDFGLAKDVSGAPADPDDVTQTGVFLGSPKYVSPEQVQGDPLDARSDVYSLGVVLYEMLTGAPPFAFEQPMQVLMAHVRDAPPELHAPAGRAAIPAALASVVLRALAKRREERQPDMEALLVEIKEALGGGSSISRDLLLSTTGEREVRSGVHSLPSTARDPLGTSSVSGAVAAPVPSVPSTPAPPSAASISVDLTLEGSGAHRGAEGPRGARSRASILAVGLLSALALAAAGAWAAMDARDEPARAPTESARAAAPAPARPAEPSAGSAGAEPRAEPALERAIPAPPPSPRSVILALRSDPPGAIASLGDRELGPTPAEIELTGELALPGREHEIVFRRAGYRDATERVTVDGERIEVEGRLVRVSRPGGARPERGSTTESEREVHVEGYRDSPY